MVWEHCTWKCGKKIPNHMEGHTWPTDGRQCKFCLLVSLHNQVFQCFSSNRCLWDFTTFTFPCLDFFHAFIFHCQSWLCESQVCWICVVIHRIQLQNSLLLIIRKLMTSRFVLCFSNHGFSVLIFSHLFLLFLLLVFIILILWVWTWLKFRGVLTFIRWFNFSLRRRGTCCIYSKNKLPLVPLSESIKQSGSSTGANITSTL